MGLHAVRIGLRPGRATGIAATLILATALLQLAPVAGEDAPSTPWGEPDLQGIWTNEYQAPWERPATYADRAFFTEAERADLDAQRARMLGRDHREERGTERDVSGAYNHVFTSVKHASRRTSLISDPSGRFPPLTPEAIKRRDIAAEYRLALLQATNTCRNKEIGCRGGTFGPPSPRRTETPPTFTITRLNRSDGPEDRGLAERCLSSALPSTGGYVRMVQSPGSVAILYDVGQGQGWQRNIPITAAPHLPATIRQWFGDSRARWEGGTLVVDVTNFSPKSAFFEARENLHLVEKWTRLDARTMRLEVMIEDPTTWTRPWNVTVEMTRQDEQANRIYYEPRCHEGNMGMAGMLLGARYDERAFAEGRGPDPATMDWDTQPEGGAGGGPENVDPLASR